MQACWLTAICLIPATVAYLGQSATGSPASSDPSFLRVLLLYATMALAGGVVLGLLRPALGTRVGSLLVGALVGAVAFTILLWNTAAPEADAPVVRVTGAALGALTGTLLAGYAWRRFRELR